MLDYCAAGGSLMLVKPSTTGLSLADGTNLKFKILKPRQLAVCLHPMKMLETRLS
ncbi:MAG: hypothetical protein RMX96_27315 [Nostoc sp. ChiSLP02]|nr:hypothetical protein [Nostoc sp. DedSLP05]MDZ8100903.1 hypothetical protein [Nostoc sp. DedSLP01]MDZ8188552.1 hypothetical protein [Nostoc sp. ChiSLP02]